MATRAHRCAASRRAIRAMTPRPARCRTSRHESAIAACAGNRRPPWARESEELLSLTAYVALQSRGVPLAVTIDGPARAAFERGRAFYEARHGQMNLACAQCHDQNWGKRLLSETVSQGHGNAFPAYRLEWQSLGSLQRRIRACLFGIRAEMPPSRRAGAHRPRALPRVARAGAAARSAGREALRSRRR